jgi:outer membrane protein X
MNNVLKRVAIAAIAVVTISMTALAQKKGDMAVGGSVTLGSGDSYSNYGIGAKFQYNILTPLRLEGSFTYFLKKDYLTMWDLSVNAHWLFPITDKLTVYPLAGAGLLNYGTDLGLGGYGVSDTSTSDIAYNLGGGIDLHLTDNLSLNAEAKYKISDVWDRLLLSAGITYRF